MFFRYVNGKTYMEDVANALEEAKEEIFITDWWSVLLCYNTRVSHTHTQVETSQSAKSLNST